MRPRALEAYVRAAALGANPSAQHAEGRQARDALESARERLAAACGARPSELIATSGGTESDNLAIKGLFAWARARDPRRRRILVSAIEHRAVLESAQYLAAAAGAQLTLLPVDGEGAVDLDALAAELEAHGEEVALVSVMWANNEVGTVEPVRRIAQMAHASGALAHSDGVQALGHVPVDFDGSGLDALTVSGHKAGGPPGSGALLVRRGIAPVPVLHGGGQERGVRSGTLDVPGLAGFAAAAEEAVSQLGAERTRLEGLAAQIRRAVSAVPGGRVSGPDGRRPAEAGPRPRSVPGLVHATFEHCDADALLFVFDAAGFAVSVGAACSAGVTEPSHVLKAMGLPLESARGAVRISAGWSTTRAEVGRLCAALPGLVARARAAAVAGAIEGAVA